MKYFGKILCGVILPVSLLQADCNESCEFAHTSKSYLNVRPQGQSHSPELLSAFRYDRIDARENGHNGGVQFVAFGSKSTDSDRLSRYFSVFGKPVMRVKSSTTVSDSGQEGDILADYFNVFTANGAFESTISFCPEQSTWGFIAYGRKSFCRNEDKERGFWASMSFPVIRVKNKMNFHETVVDNGGGADEAASPTVVANMTEAFRQSAWKYGKITCGDLTETGVADIELKLGYEWLVHEPCHLESYIGVVVPTGNTPKGCYVFEPVVGNGHHFGIMWGGAAGILFYEDEARDRQLRAEIACHTQYLFSKEQVRSFDMKYKPWSRYMGVYTSMDQATEADVLPTPAFQTNFQTPGINIFTRPVDVTPGFSHDINSALTYSCKKTYIELGWNFYARQDECLELACSFPKTVAFKALSGGGDTSVIRNITGQSDLDSAGQIPLISYQTAVVDEDELDLNSAASPAFISHTVYGTIGYRCPDHKYPIVAALGGSYEVAADTNASVDRWMIWGKVGFSF